jgi:hypothetical protein
MYKNKLKHWKLWNQVSAVGADRIGNPQSKCLSHNFPNLTDKLEILN